MIGLSGLGGGLRFTGCPEFNFYLKLKMHPLFVKEEVKSAKEVPKSGKEWQRVAKSAKEVPKRSQREIKKS
jgi:hypothetical protein